MRKVNFIPISPIKYGAFKVYSSAASVSDEPCVDHKTFKKIQLRISCLVSCFTGGKWSVLSFAKALALKLKATSSFVYRQRLEGHFTLMFALICFTADHSHGDDKAKDELYRRGYPNSMRLEEAVSDYNRIHRLDIVAQQYPELDVKEIKPAIKTFLRKLPAKDVLKRAQVKSLLETVSRGFLPKGSLLSFQYSNKNRTVYWHKPEKLLNSFYIVLWSGLNENPPGEGEFNQKANIVSISIRYSIRNDEQYFKQKK